MVNGKSVKLAIKLAEQVGLPLGLHLNLTEGHPLEAKTFSANSGSEGEAPMARTT